MEGQCEDPSLARRTDRAEAPEIEKEDCSSIIGGLADTQSEKEDQAPGTHLHHMLIC